MTGEITVILLLFVFFEPFYTYKRKTAKVVFITLVADAFYLHVGMWVFKDVPECQDVSAECYHKQKKFFVSINASPFYPTLILQRKRENSRKDGCENKRKKHENGDIFEKLLIFGANDIKIVIAATKNAFAFRISIPRDSTRLINNQKEKRNEQAFNSGKH